MRVQGNLSGQTAWTALRRWSRYPYVLGPPAPVRPPEGMSGADGRGGVGAGPKLHAFVDGVRRLPPFGRLAMVHGLSSGADAMVAVALAGSVFFDVSARAAQSRVALSLALTVAPFAVVGPLLGPAVERVPGGRRALALASAAGRALSCFFMASAVHSLVLFPLAFFTLVLSKLYMVTKAALVPTSVGDPSELVRANSKLAVGGSAASTVAGAGAAAVLEIFSASTVLRVAMVVYLACAWAASRLTSSSAPAPAGGTSRLEPIAPGAPGAPAGPGPLLDAPAPAGPDAPRRRPYAGLPPGGLQLAALATGSLRFSSGFVTFLVVFTFRRGGASFVWYGLALGASQLGNLAGALLAPRLRHRAPEEWILTGSATVIGAVSLVMGVVDWSSHWLVAVALAGAVGLAAGAGKLAFDSMVQRDVPSRARVRSFARFESGFQLSWAVGGLLAVVVAMPLADGFVAIGAVGLLGAAAFAEGSVRARRGTLPRWWPGSAPRPVPPGGDLPAVVPEDRPPL
jgi:MFS family permease